MFYYSESHKMKGTACVLFGVAMCHRLVTGVKLIGVVMLITGDHALIMAGYTRNMLVKWW